MPWLKVAHMAVYAIFIHKISFALSRTAPEVKRWYNRLIIFFIGFILSYASYFLLVQMPFFNSQWDYMISLCMTIFIYGLALMGYMQPQVFGLVYAPPGSPNVKYKNSGLTETAAQQLQERLSHWMQQQKLYRNSDLRLEKLADILHTSRHNLSQVINERFGQSFFDYLNTLRIEEAKELLASTTKQDMTIIEIAYQVGFNNKVSFNSTFKKLTNFTPSEYRNLHVPMSSKENTNGQRATLH
ncbi:MAG: helix-turn-helix transcriptional regulator [Saprospiraceae bacterium]|nr:helix-turn-helix transcriptional regulator [Saprospiraceae bacterium]